MAYGLTVSQSRDELDDFCKKLGLVAGRDTDKTVVQVFRAVLLYYPNKDFGSTELSRRLKMNRITCIHHLNRLERSGVVRRHRTKYMMNASNMEDLVQEMRREALEAFDELEKLASELDEAFFTKRRHWPL